MDKHNKKDEDRNAFKKHFVRWYSDVDELTSYTEQLDKHDKRQLGDEMLRDIKNKLHLSPERHRIKSWFRKPALYAASVACLLIVGLFYFNMSNKITYRTHFGEIQKIKLPDSSLVLLNGNSVLTYYTSIWSSDRHVQLTGEATFNVVHTNTNQRFRVHISDSTTIEVLGTEFNVLNRPTHTTVALRRGKIDFQYKSQDANQHFTMKPGQSFSFKANKRSYQLRENKNIDDFFSWQKRKFLLNRTSLSSLLDTLLDTYGLKLSVADHNLLSRSATGSFPLSTSQTEMLSNIALLYDLKIVEKNNELLVFDKHK